MKNNIKSNLILRFFLEVLTLIFCGMWAYKLGDGYIGLTLSFLFPFIISLIWGVFNVLGDPSRNGKTFVKVSGWTRLKIEAVIFLIGVYCLSQITMEFIGLLYFFIILFHYLMSKERILWLIKQK